MIRLINQLQQFNISETDKLPNSFRKGLWCLFVGLNWFVFVFLHFCYLLFFLEYVAEMFVQGWVDGQFGTFPRKLWIYLSLDGREYFASTNTFSALNKHLSIASQLFLCSLFLSRRRWKLCLWRVVMKIIFSQETCCTLVAGGTDL